jgi:hypothetical protein
MHENSVIHIESLDFYPLTSDRWDDLVRLFGAHGASSGCWCMYWRLPRKQFDQNCHNCGENNRQALQALVQAGIVRIDRLSRRTAGLCVFGCPREDFSSLERSRTLKRLDDRPVWSIVCFFVTRSTRHQGCMLSAIRAAVEYAHRHGHRSSRPTRHPSKAIARPASFHRQSGYLFESGLPGNRGTRQTPHRSDHAVAPTGL